LLFTGEPGIGKTWLADEAAVHVASRGMRVYWGRCFEDGGAPAYWPWIQVLRGVVADAGSQYSRTLPADIVRMLPELAAEAPRPEAGDAERLRFRLFDAVARLLKESASAKPIMLVLDDLHDADVASLQLLKFVARMVHDAQLIIVGIYRDAEMRRSQERAAIIPDLLREATHLSLVGLVEDEVGQMVEVRAQQAPDPDFVAALCRTTSGNPLFVDGIIRVLVAEGSFGSAQPMGLTSYKLPDQVRAAILGWLGLLSPEARTLLTTAALIGLEFELGLLAKANATAPERVAELIAGAQDTGIVSSVGKSSWRFTHPLLRGALSQEPRAGERVRLHRTIATALEQIHEANTQSHISLLAHHWRESAQSPDEVDKAIDYSIRAGDSAAKALAMGEAVSRWEDALRLNKEHQRDLPQRADILVRLGGLDALAGRGKEVLKNLEDAVTIYEHLGMTSKAADIHARLCQLHHQDTNFDLPKAERHFREAEALFREMPPSESMARLYCAWCWICFWRVRIAEAFEAARHAVDIAKEHAGPSIRAQTRATMAGSLCAMGRLDEWFAEYDRAWHEADQVNDSLAERITQGATFCLNKLSDHREALKWLRREMARPRNNERVFYGLFVISAQIEVHLLMGELGEGGRLLRNIVEPGIRWLDESYLKLWAGELEVASARFGAIVDHARSQQRPQSVCVFGHLLAYIRHWVGHVDTAIQVLEEGLSYSVPGGDVPLEMKGRQGLSHIYAQTGRLEEARANLARCRDIMAAGGDWRGVGGLVSLSEAAIAAAEQRFDDADRSFADALAAIRRYGIGWIEGPALCDWGRALATAGRRDRALEKFDEAIELYRRIGAGQPWIDRAEAERATVGSIKSQVATLGQTSVEAQFRKEGDYWTVSYGGETFRLQDSKACTVIAHLLRHPGHQFHARELVALDSGLLSPGSALGRDEADQISADLGDAGPGLDARARTAYQAHLNELHAEIDEAERDNDLGRAEKLRAEADELSSHIIREAGFRGHERKQSSHSERARLAVTKSIRRAIEKIRELNPTLGRHLANSIRTGYFCSYAPDQESQVAWRR
jgi:tetratricopeptide (TPR) repeat protein